MYVPDFFVLVSVSFLLQISSCMFKIFGFSPLKPNPQENPQETGEFSCGY
jgi:hypothetical protein